MKKVTAAQFARLIDRISYPARPLETGAPLHQTAKQNGLIAMYGMSDDLFEVRGAIDEEFGAYDGRIFFLDGEGVYQSPVPGAVEVEAAWCPEIPGHPSWGISLPVTVPVHEFKIVEDDEIFCIGLVVDLKDLPAPTRVDRIVGALIRDIGDRRGMDAEWDSMDSETQSELIQTWRSIIEKEMDNGS